MKIDKVLAMDYRATGRKILQEFIAYTESLTEADIERTVRELNRRLSEPMA